MDWTYSPYIALHFALANLERFDLDGVIWRINYEQVHDRLPSELKEQLAAEGAQAFTVELLTSIGQERPDWHAGEKTFHQYVETLTQFDALGRSEEFLLFFEPPSSYNFV